MGVEKIENMVVDGSGLVLMITEAKKLVSS